MIELGSEIEAALESWFGHELDRAWRAYQSGDHARAIIPEGASGEEATAIARFAMSEEAERRIADIQSEMLKAASERKYGSATPIAAELLSSLKEPPFEEGSQEFTALKLRIMERLAEIEDARFRWAGGDDEYQPKLGMVRDAPAVEASSTASGTEPDVTTMGELLEIHLLHVESEKRPSTTNLSQLRSHLQEIVEILGKDTKVTSVSAKMAGDVFEIYRSLPPNYENLSELRGLDIRNAAVAARTNKLRAMSPETINNRMTSARGLFKEAIDKGILSENPFKGKRIKLKRKSGSERGFTQDELVSIISSPLFVGCERDGRPFQPGQYLKNDWRFWLPMVAMLSGARIGELCQLTASDVRQLHDVWVLDVVDDGDKSLKTISSRRLIPIHDRLIELGFLEFVASRPESGEVGSLFDIPPPKNGDWGHKAGGWFSGKFLLSLWGEKKRYGTGWHSFRHNVETSMREAGVRQDVSHKLTGHAAADAAAGYGAYKLGVLKDAVMKIRVPKALDSVPSRRL